MEHQYYGYDDCDELSDDMRRWILDGGLGLCKVCGLLEGSLTTDCPGVQSYSQYADEVYQGRMDFRDGQWVNAKSPHSPGANFSVRG